MFNKKPVDEPETSKPEPAAQTSPNVRTRKTSIIGPTVTIRGELSANEDLIIEGTIEGSIAHHDKNLSVGREGLVKADIDARTVEVYGRLEGDIRGQDSVKLAKTAEVTGNIRCTRIIMEDGAQFIGSVDTTRKKKTTTKPTALPVADQGKPIESAS
ncbi:MAG: polymer-forming cytoskeletal protein [Pseudomonadota bacterium]